MELPKNNTCDCRCVWTAMWRTLAPAHSEMNIDKGNGMKYAAYSVWNTDEESCLSSQTRHTSKTNSFSIPSVEYLFRICVSLQYGTLTRFKYLEVLRITSPSDGCNHFTQKGIWESWFTHWSHCVSTQIPYISDLPKNNNTNIYLLTPSIYGPLTALAFIITDFYSSLSNAFHLHIQTFISSRSFSTYSRHLILGLLLLLLPSGLLSNISLTVLP